MDAMSLPAVPPALPAPPASAPAVAPRSTLSFDRALPPWEALTAALQSILGYAAAQVARVERDPARAVHEYRKSIRRARAIVRLARPLVSPRRYQHLDDELRQAVLDTSFLRDAEVLAGTVEVLPRRDDLAAAIDDLRARLLSQQASATTPEAVREVLARGTSRTALLPMRFARALPARLAWDDVERALRASYRRVRSARRVAIDTRADEDIHRWRKRTKELRYQLEALEPGDQPHERALGELAKALGLITDLMILRAAVRAHAPSLGAARTALLVETLDGMIPPRFDAVAGDAAPFFAPGKKAFARAVLDPPDDDPPAADPPAAPVARPRVPGGPAMGAAPPIMPRSSARVPARRAPALPGRARG
jgi:CHAD domain-containing protein